MTERGLPLADGASACPFVAFEDDRDERASVPDHRHRCYAETRPAPKALAHQEAYCLSSAFPVCPTFQDWARREAARARDAADAAAAASGAGLATGGGVGGGRVGGGAVAAGGAAAASAAGAGLAADGMAGGANDDDPPEGPGSTESSPPEPARPATPAYRDAADSDEFGVRRNPPRDWAAPPPWLASAEGSGDEDDPGAPAFLSHRAADPGQGLAGSAADRLAGGPPLDPRPAAAGALAASEAARAASARPSDDEALDEAERDGEPPRRPARRPRAYEQHLGGTDGPDWERPRRYEAYPTIKTPVGMPNLPRVAIMAGALAVAAIAVFFLPALLGIGSPSGPGASVAQSRAPIASRAPTPVPAPTPILYTIKKGDLLSKIATAHGLTLEELMAANPQIKNPDKIVEGQQITIPTPGDVSPAAGGSAGSSAAP